MLNGCLRAQWIYSNSPQAREAYAKMPRKRRSLFRDVYAHDFARGIFNLQGSYLARSYIRLLKTLRINYQHVATLGMS